MAKNRNDLIDILTQTFPDEPDTILGFIGLIRQELFGIIIVDDPDNPKRYWTTDGPMFFSMSAEYPKCFTSIATATKTLLKIKQTMGETWHLSLWLHPESHLLPMDKYTDLRSRFPGSPRH